MRSRRFAVARVFALMGAVAATLLTVSCAHRPPPTPVTATLPRASLRVHDEPEVTHDGITLAITPVTAENVRRFPQLTRHVTWTETVLGRRGLPMQVTRSFDVGLTPAPSFQVHIVNHTGHVVRFTTSIFRLQDDLSRTYQLFGGAAELTAWVQAQPNMAARPDIMAQASSAAALVPLMNRNTELLNGDDWSGFLVFNLGVSGYHDGVALLDQVNRWTLRIAEVPVDTNEAGVASRTTEFHFVIDRTLVPVSVTCPAGTAMPTWDVCQSSGGAQ